MKHIALDLETTGLDPSFDRIIEVGCVLIVDGIPTNKTFQSYVNPGVSVSSGAFRVHGLDNAFLSRYEPFYHIADHLLDFLEEHPLVIHNASFDMSFLDTAFEESHGLIASKRHEVIDTLDVARKELPHMRSHSLDALCKHFDISLGKRVKHGALIDAELLAEVYHFLSGTDIAQSLPQKTKEQKKGLSWKGQDLNFVPEHARLHNMFMNRALGEKSMWKREKS